MERWRADFAHLPAHCLIEIEGGIWVNGRHNRAAGFNADLEPSRLAGGEMDSAQRNPEGWRPVRRGASQKYLEAGLSGWRVFRLGPDQIKAEALEFLLRYSDQFHAEAAYWFELACLHCQAGDPIRTAECTRRAVDLDRSYQMQVLDHHDLDPLKTSWLGIE